jgi:hypothetical protein
MCSNRIINRILLAASALAMMLLAACNGPVRVPIQPQPQAQAYPILVTPLGQFVPDLSRPGIGAQFAPVPGRTPAAGPSAAEALLHRLLSSVNR